MRGITILVFVIFLFPFLQGTNRIDVLNIININLKSISFESKGDSCLSENNFSKAIEYYHIAINSIGENNNSYEAKLLIKIGASYFNTNNLNGAISNLNHGISLYNPGEESYTKLGDYGFVISGILLLSNSYRLLERFDSALIALNNLEQILNRIGDKIPKIEYIETQAEVHSYKGLIYFDSREHEKSMLYNLEAIALLDRYPEIKHLTYNNYAQIGRICLFEKDFYKSERYYLKALGVVVSYFGENSIVYAEQLEELGLVYYESNRYNEALNCFNSVLDIWKSTLHPDNIQFAYTYNNIADALCGLNQLSSCIMHYQEALSLFLKHNYINESCIVYHNLGIMNFMNKEYKNSEEYYLKSLQLSQKHRRGKNVYTAYTYQRLGQLYSVYQDWTSAIRYYSRAINELITMKSDSSYYDALFIQNNISCKSELYKSLYLKGVCEYNVFLNASELSYLEQSINSFQKALQLLDVLRKQSLSQNTILLLNHDVKSIIDKYVLALVKYLDIKPSYEFENRLFEAIDRNKYTGLRSLLHTTKSKYNEKLPSRHAASIDTLYRIVRLNENELLRGKQGDIISERQITNNDLFNSTFSLDTLIYSLKNRYPEFHDIHFSPRYYEIKDIQNRLSDSTGILEYFYSDSLIVLFAITNKTYKIATLPKTTRIDQEISLLKESILFSNTTQFYRSSIYLYETLIKPVGSILSKVSHLMIVPDMAFSSIPFEVLISSNINNTESNPNYMIINYAISYYLSLSLWIDNINISNKKKYDYEFSGFAPMASLNKNNEIHSLPNSKKEIDNIAFIFDEKGKKSISNACMHSTDLKILNELTKSRIVHIASHRGIDTHSGIHYIATANNISTTLIEEDNMFCNNDGRLDLVELFNNNTFSELVALSVCSAGQGKEQIGEGVLSLSYGLYYSGAKNILYTLWDVSDYHSSEFMYLFYSFVSCGENYPEALRKAKINFINSNYMLPVFWSGYVLNG